VEHALKGDESRVSRKWQVESAKRTSAMKKTARKYRKLDAMKEKKVELQEEWQRYIDSRAALGLEIPTEALLGPKLPEGGTKYFRKGMKEVLEWPEETPKIRKLLRDSNGHKVDFIVDDEKMVMEGEIIGPERERLTINAKAVRASDWMWEMPGIVEVRMQHQDDYPENGVRGGEKDDDAVMYRGMSAFHYVKEQRRERLNKGEVATEEATGQKKARGKQKVTAMKDEPLKHKRGPVMETRAKTRAEKEIEPATAKETKKTKKKLGKDVEKVVKKEVKKQKAEVGKRPKTEKQ